MTTTPKPIPLKDGTVRFRVRFRTEKGTNPLSKTFDTADAAQRFADLVDAVGGAAALQALNATVSADRGRTMQTAFDEMIEAKRSDNTGGSIRSAKIRGAHWLPMLGPYPVTAVTEQLVRSWLSKRRKDPGRYGGTIAWSTIDNDLVNLRMVLHREVKRGTIRTNPAEDVKVPKDAPRHHQPVFLTPDQLSDLWAAVPDEWRLLVQVASGTGIRWGEVSCLKAQSLDLHSEPPTIHITSAWKQGEDGRLYEGPPKNGKSRTVSLPHSLVAPLREHVRDRKLSGEDLLWSAEDGGPLSSSRWWGIWDKSVRDANLGVRPHFHDLRHTHASMLIAAGVPMKVISERLGHSSIGITMDVYGHLQPDAAIKAAATVDRVMFGATNALPAA